MSYSLARRITPNRSARTDKPIYLVIHATEGSYAGSVAWLCNPAAQASADEVLKMDGSAVTVLNDDLRLKSWQVGNANSLCARGYELEGYTGTTHWPDRLYATLADRLRKGQSATRAAYGVTIPLRPSRFKGDPGIVTHKQVAAWYGGSDHTDPGPTFSFDKLAAALAPAPTWTSAQRWNLAAWYVGVGKFADVTPRRDPAKRPPGPKPFDKGTWARVAWYVAHRPKPAAPAPAPKVEWLQVLDKDGKLIAEGERGTGGEAKVIAEMKWAVDARQRGPLTVRVVMK